MKKIYNFFRRILLFFDKWLITPITKGILTITSFSKNNGKELEKLINKKQTLIVLSLVFAFIVFFVVDQNSNMIINKQAEVLYNQPVIAEYNQESYVIEGLPETVDITIIGRKSDLYLAKQYPSDEVSVDLRGLKPGSHKVSLKYNQRLSSIDYKIDPSSATIVIYEKVSKTRELDYDVLHKDDLDKKLVLDNIDLSRNDVIIKGAEYKLKEVATVKALVDINNISKPTVGEITLSNIPLIAYDSKGNVVDVEIVPATIDATLSITSPSKDVPIEILPVGDIAFGKSIQLISSSIEEVTIYGDQDILDKITSIPVEIDVSGLSEEKSYNVNLKKPSGIRDISSKTINIKVTLDDVVTKEISNVSITPVNLDPNLEVNAISEADAHITVVVKGSAAVIESLDQATITAQVDLSGYPVGDHEVEVKVTGSDVRLTYESKVKKVKVRISEK
ncbi:MAG: CdaR family protein [bacterium]|nr:CdaR family protein [bacterium]